MIDRLYKTRVAGELLGGLHPNDVLALVRLRKLRAVKQQIRGEGKRPRLYIPASAITDYIKSLPDANSENQQTEEPGRRESRRHLPRDLREELGRIKQYH